MKPEVTNTVVHLRVLMDSAYFKMYANERRLYNIPELAFRRDSVIRIALNGGEGDGEAVFLTSICVAESETDVLYDALSRNGRWATQGILFRTGKSQLRPESRPVLKEIAGTMKQYGDLKILIEGHTDNVGSPASNLTSSGGEGGGGEGSARRRVQRIRGTHNDEGTRRYQAVGPECNGRGPGTEPACGNRQAVICQARNALPRALSHSGITHKPELTMKSVRWYLGSKVRITIATVGMTMGAATVASAAPDLNMYELSDGSRWIVGCVENNQAVHLLAAEAFQSAGPVSVLCLVGYTAVHKELR